MAGCAARQLLAGKIIEGGGEVNAITVNRNLRADGEITEEIVNGGFAR